MNKLWVKYPEIESDLKKVIDLMEKNAKCKDKIVEESILELIKSGGKMLRPAFVILGGQFGNYNRDKTVPTAAVVEMLHMATLVHDDVIDNSKLRRGKETIQYKYGTNYAVYIGDFLFCNCFKVLASNSSLQAIKLDSRAMSKIWAGEISQLQSRFSTKLSVKDYLSRISGKTAELFSLALYLGAAECEADPKVANRLARIGRYLGMAFQIIDDILDYEGSDESIKKSAANDLKQGIYTVPFIYAVRNNRAALGRYVGKRDLTEIEINEVVNLVRENRGIDEARILARKYTDKCFKEIDNLPENPYKYVIKEIAEWMLKRGW